MKKQRKQYAPEEKVANWEKQVITGFHLKNPLEGYMESLKLKPCCRMTMRPQWIFALMFSTKHFGQKPTW
jgi:hypothetical protein